VSSDIDLAYSLAQTLKNSSKKAADALKDFEKMLAIFRSVEQLTPEQTNSSSKLPKEIFRGQLLGAIRDAQRFAPKHKIDFDLPLKPIYDILNDNRHEQHYWTW
jgi:hypothetical protein